MSEAKWYVVHTYSGYENKVKANIDKTIENRHLEDQILEVRVPMEDVVEMKNGVQKATGSFQYITNMSRYFPVFVFSVIGDYIKPFHFLPHYLFLLFAVSYFAS